jgi:uncharacterized protein YdeI (YjbR/CyaY-like superfamily)
MTESEPAFFKTAAAFRAWLRVHHRSSTALVVRVHKAHAADQGLTYAAALDEVLCYGWIDGVRRRLDAHTFSIRFSPRKPRSIWSRVNVAHVARLTAAGRMTQTGLAVFSAREEARTGVYSFERKPVTLAPALAKRFRAQRSAWEYFQSEAPWYRRTSVFWIMSAKREETRVRRLQTLMECSAKGLRLPGLQRSEP